MLLSVPTRNTEAGRTLLRMWPSRQGRDDPQLRMQDRDTGGPEDAAFSGCLTACHRPHPLPRPCHSSAGKSILCQGVKLVFFFWLEEQAP